MPTSMVSLLGEFMLIMWKEDWSGQPRDDSAPISLAPLAHQSQLPAPVAVAMTAPIATPTAVQVAIPVAAPVATPVATPKTPAPVPTVSERHIRPVILLNYISVLD